MPERTSTTAGTVILVTIGLAIVVSAVDVRGEAEAAAALPPLASSSDVPALVRALADADPERRELAADRLVQIGAPARDAVLGATGSDNPEIAHRAAHVLLKLPWARPDDPPAVRQALRTYGRFVEAERKMIVSRLVELSEVGVLMRLLVEDPGAAVRWHIAASLALSPEPETLARIRAVGLDADVRSAPALVTAGRAWMLADPPRGLALFRRAVALERSQPTNDVVEIQGARVQLMPSAYHTLLTAAFNAGDPEEAAGILRARADRAGYRDDPPDAVVAQLFALHAYQGPLPDYAGDLRTYGALLGRPTVPDEAWLLMRRLGVGGTRPLCRAAYHALPLSALNRTYAARFLLVYGRPDDARTELAGAIAAARAEHNPRLEVDAHQRLAGLSMERDDHAAAAVELRRAVALMEQHKSEFDDRDRSEQWGEIHWQEFKAARGTGDAAAAARHLDELVKAPPAHADAVLDMMQVLGEQGRADDAERVFDGVYRQLKARVDADPLEVNHANNLAWMLARAGRKVDEAVELSRRAIAAEPHNAAYLDTAAEAHFAAGNAEEAIRLETLALQQRPDDKFMLGQLERFRAARTMAKPKDPARKGPG